jgi:transcriptional regulator with GAF, ATPase, and Fis domain
MEALLQYPWPGNIRELRNVIERAMIVSQGPALHVELPSLTSATIATRSSSPVRTPPTNGQTLGEIERCHILTVLEKTGWRVSGKNGAAEILGLKPTTLESRMAKLGIKRQR